MKKIRKKKSNNKGFTLVELIVVIVILAILAAILVPALLGYIDKAKQQKGVHRVHEIKVASTAALVEYYGLRKGKTKKIFTERTYTVNGSSFKAYNITNWTFAQLQDKEESDNDCSDAVAKSLLRYLDSHKDAKTKAYTFKKYSSSTYGKNASEIAKAGAEGLIILFNSNCKLVMIQYSDLDGYLYTYDARSGQIKVEEDGKFIAEGKK